MKNILNSFCVTILLLVQCYPALSDDPRIDSLKSLLFKAEGTRRIDILNDLAKGTLYTDLKVATDYSEEAAQSALALDYSEGLVIAKVVQAAIANNLSDTDKAKGLLQEAIALSEKMDYTYGKSYANLSMAVLQIHLTRYDSAILNSFEGLKAATAINNPDLKLANLLNIAAIKQMTKAWEDAAKYLADAVEIAKANNAQIRLGQIYGNLAMVSFNQNNIGDAIKYHFLSLEVFQAMGMRHQESKTLHNLGIAFLKLGEHVKAMDFLNQALIIRRELGDQLGMARTLRHMGDLRVKTLRLEEGISYLTESEELALSFKSFDLLRDIYHSLFEAYQLKKNPTRALASYQSFVEMKDSIAARYNVKLLAELNAEFEFERLEGLNRLQRQESEMKDLRIAQRNRIIVIICISLLVLVIGFLWSRYLLTNRLEHTRKEKIIAEKEQRIVSQELNTDKLKLIHFAEQLLSQNKELEEKKSQLEEQVAGDTMEKKKVDELVEKLRDAITDQKDWTAFRLYFDKAYPGLYEEIKVTKGVELTLSERRLIALIKIGLSNKEIGSILGISRNSVVRASYRLKQKLNFVDTKTLESYIISL